MSGSWTGSLTQGSGCVKGSASKPSDDSLDLSPDLPAERSAGVHCNCLRAPKASEGVPGWARRSEPFARLQSGASGLPLPGAPGRPGVVETEYESVMY